MDLLAERGRRVTVDELNTTRLLAHARKQAVQRNLDDLLIVDVDAHRELFLGRSDAAGDESGLIRVFSGEFVGHPPGQDVQIGL